MLAAIVTTTINPPAFLESYIQNFTKFDINPDEVVFIIVGDNKTPIEYQYLSSTKGFGLLYPIEYWSPEDQERWIKETFTNPLEIKRLIVPHNDPRRRNFGFLRAQELGAEVIITIDDDNLPDPKSDWLGDHLNGLDLACRLNVHSPNGIINPCRVLDINEPWVYSRGYPISEFFSDDLFVYSSEKDCNKSILNMGLWTQKPDVDSFTNILCPELHSFGPKFPFSHLEAIGKNYFPINTQNTSFRKKISIFHNLYMEPTLVHRYDDIWMGLFAQRLSKKMGDTMTFGLPLAMHKRNTHNYQKDLSTEFLGIGMNSKMWKEVRGMDISSKSYEDGFLEIADKLPTFHNQEINKFLETMKESMRLWVDLVDKLK